MNKIKIYFDSGVSAKNLKEIEHLCEFYQFPYDSPYRPKKSFRLALPSEAQWNDCNIQWLEATDIYLSDFQKSSLFDVIKDIIGTSNRRDVLHFDSAIKTGCHAFLTSDKKDIWSKRLELEAATGIRVFYAQSETRQLIQFIQDFGNNIITLQNKLYAPLIEKIL